MKAIFLSDAHLQRCGDPGYRAFVEFLGRLRGADGRRKAEGPGPVPSPFLDVTDLFLAGDIFDFWFSRNGRVYPDFKEVVDLLKSLQAEGTAIHLCEGNHDFFLKGYFSDILGMAVYEDWAVIERDGRKILVSHGDLVDQTNIHYLRLRKFLRSPLLNRLQRLLPLSLLWRLARFSSSMSKEYMSGAEERIAEAMRVFAQKKFHEGFDAVILGHCHRPQLEEVVVGGKKRVFATLGDWLRHDSFLAYEDGRFVMDSQKRVKNV